MRDQTHLVLKQEISQMQLGVKGRARAKYKKMNTFRNFGHLSFTSKQIFGQRKIAFKSVTEQQPLASIELNYSPFNHEAALLDTRHPKHKPKAVAFLVLNSMSIFGRSPSVQK